jgi:hypothetical protein
MLRCKESRAAWWFCEESEGSTMTRANDGLTDVAFAACCRSWTMVRISLVSCRGAPAVGAGMTA